MGNTCCNLKNYAESEFNQLDNNKSKTKDKNGQKASWKASNNTNGVLKDDPEVPIEYKNTKDTVTITKAAFVLAKDTKFTDDYDLKDTLGEGAYGVVGKCINKDSGAVRAVKLLSKAKLSKDELKNIANEIKIVKELDHPNIVKVYEEYEDHKYLYIVTELIEGGELFDELIARKKFSESD